MLFVYLVVMLPSVGLANRIFRAVRHLETEVGERMTHAKLGDLVAAEMGRSAPYSSQAVSLWLKDGVRDVDVLWGLARACGVRPAWLAFAEGDMRAAPLRDTPAPVLNPRPKRTAEEAIQALRAGQADVEAPAPPAAGRRRRAT